MNEKRKLKYLNFSKSSFKFIGDYILFKNASTSRVVFGTSIKKPEQFELAQEAASVQLLPGDLMALMMFPLL
jgi:hypothetical protein